MKKKDKKVIKNHKCTNTPGVFKGNDGKLYGYNRHTKDYELLESNKEVVFSVSKKTKAIFEIPWGASKFFAVSWEEIVSGFLVKKFLLLSV